ncbi:MAG: hypothetical protein EGR77_10875 [Pseudobutyrivibrio sp.]|nr:hypothetical protein [Pseudobutyrivibrio sp.]
MSSKKNKTIHIGFSTILMVFTMLCLVTFATLSLLTANADYRLSKKVAAKTEDYYEADLLAREYLLQIDEALEELYQNNAGQNAFCQEALKRLQEMPLPQGITKSSASDEMSYGFEIAINDAQILSVVLELQEPQSDTDCFYTIKQWKTTVMRDEENEEETLHLLTR